MTQDQINERREMGQLRIELIEKLRKHRDPLATIDEPIDVEEVGHALHTINLTIHEIDRNCDHRRVDGTLATRKTEGRGDLPFLERRCEICGNIVHRRPAQKAATFALMYGDTKKSSPNLRQLMDKPHRQNKGRK